MSWYEVGDYPQSIADLTEAIRLDPEEDFSRRSLSYLFNDQPEEAQADMDAARRYGCGRGGDASRRGCAASFRLPS